MDENKTPDSNEPTPEPIPEPTPAPEPEPAAQTPPPADPIGSFANAATNASAQKGGPVPFSGPPDPSVPQDEKTQALLVWVLSIVIGFIGPLIFLLTAKDKKFVYHHAAQALAFHIVLLVLWIICGLLICAAGIGLLLMPIVALAALAVSIMGLIAANGGSYFEPPISGNLSKSWFKA